MNTPTYTDDFSNSHHTEFEVFVVLETKAENLSDDTLPCYEASLNRPECDFVNNAVRS